MTLVLLSFVVAILLAARFSGSDPSATTAVQPVKKFRARPGTERENARAIVSSVPSAPSGNEESSVHDGERKQREVWGRLDDGNDTSTTGTQVFGAAPNYSEGANNDRNETFAAATSEVTPRLASEPRAAEQAYQQALATARTREEHYDAAYLYANELVQRSEYAAALEVVQEQTRGIHEVSPRYFQLRVLESVCLVDAGRSKEGIAVLEAVIDAIETAPEDSTLQSVYRQAALRLARLYEADGDEGAARRLRRRVEGFFYKWLVVSG
ncbi:MAG: hypothetical protein WD873_00180 [Candidatus Hydrogenedentales bacterium]